MNESAHLQQEIFNSIKDKLPSNLSLVQTIAQVLNISTDSAYRRIRGEKPLSLEELSLLSRKFDVSIDYFLNKNSDNITFSCTHIRPENIEVREWLQKLNQDLTKLRELKNVEVFYSVKDPSIYHNFHIPEIAAFKLFFWERTLFRFPKYESQKFSLSEIPEENIKLGEHMLRMIAKTPITEIWNKDTFRMLLNQIEFYWLSGFIASKNDLKELLNKTEEWIHHMKHQAEVGQIFKYGEQPNHDLPYNFTMYCNEVILNDNTIMVKYQNGISSYITFNVLSLLQTSNLPFCTEVENHFKGLIRISNLISQSGEKERNKFFNEQLKTLQAFRNRI